MKKEEIKVSYYSDFSEMLKEHVPNYKHRIWLAAKKEMLECLVEAARREEKKPHLPKRGANIKE